MAAEVDFTRIDPLRSSQKKAKLFFPTQPCFCSSHSNEKSEDFLSVYRLHFVIITLAFNEIAPDLFAYGKIGYASW